MRYHHCERVATLPRSVALLPEGFEAVS